MLEIFGDLWEVDADLRAITTNGDVNRFGAAIMGRGCAREARERISGLEYHFAMLLRRHGNRVMRLTKPIEGAALASFPVKHHWNERADPALIRRSARQIVALATKFGYRRVLIPRSGCGNGSLRWIDVRPILAEVLDDRFYVITFAPGGPDG